MPILSFLDSTDTASIFSVTYLATDGNIDKLIEFIHDRNYMFGFINEKKLCEIDMQHVYPYMRIDDGMPELDDIPGLTQTIRETYLKENDDEKMSEFIKPKLQEMVRGVSGESMIFLNFVAPFSVDVPYTAVARELIQDYTIVNFKNFKRIMMD